MNLISNPNGINSGQFKATKSLDDSAAAKAAQSLGITVSDLEKQDVSKLTPHIKALSQAKVEGSRQKIAELSQAIFSFSLDNFTISDARTLNLAIIDFFSEVGKGNIDLGKLTGIIVSKLKLDLKANDEDLKRNLDLIDQALRELQTKTEAKIKNNLHIG
jgi:hypothetical protein